MNNTQTMAYLNSFAKFGSKLGLERLSELLNKMGNPQQKLKFVHIAGTNGKGSTSVMTANILVASGYKTGLYVSPSVLCFRERMQINGVMIPEKELVECTNFIKQYVDEMRKKAESPTQFEVETAIAFEWFMRNNCDIVCLEVGLGGRFDATNVIETSILQVITSIGFDHTAVLGESIDEIAYEKAGIIKEAPTVMYPIQKDSAKDVIRNKCNEQHSTLIVPDLHKLNFVDTSWMKSEFHYDGHILHKVLPGLFQVYNAITVVEVAKQLRKLGYRITDQELHSGIASAKLPARMEICSTDPLIILDGAHNPSGASALTETLKQLGDRRIHIIMGILADKNYKDVVKRIAPYASSFMAVTPPNPRALDGSQLALEAQKYCNETSFDGNSAHAVDVVRHHMQPDDVLIICGSLYLASQIRPVIMNLNHKSNGTLECS